MPSFPTLGVLSALLAALIWGASDYLGGFVDRHLKSFQVLLMVVSASQTVMSTLACLTGEAWLSARDLLFSLGTGISGALGIADLCNDLPLINTAFVAQFYRLYVELVTRFMPEQPIPPMPCQLCGRPRHTERFCPNAKALGFR